MPAADQRVTRAVDRCRRVAEWHGEVWRGHVHGKVRETFRTASDYAYTVLARGRWHQGRDHPEGNRFPALYTSLLGHVAEAEFLRHLDSKRRAAGGHIDLRTDRYRLSSISTKLDHVFDLRDLPALDLAVDELCEDDDYRLPQQLAAEARRRGAEGILVWSCAVEPLGTQANLIVFPDQLLPGSHVRETGTWTQIRPLP